MLDQLIYTQRKLKIIALLSLSAGAIFFAPSSIQAQTASASGSATFSSGSTITNTFGTNGNLTSSVIVNGATSSVSGEVVLPQGYFFNGIATITPSYTDMIIGGNNVGVVSALAINPGTTRVVAPNSSFNRATAQVLINSSTGNTSINNNIDSVTAIIKAGAGVNGLD